MKVQYVEVTRKNGDKVFARRIPRKGRPALFVRKGDRYIPLRKA